MWLYVNSFRVCVCVCVCVFDEIGTHTQTARSDRYPHTHRRYEFTYSHIRTLFITNVNQHSSSVTYGPGPPEDGFKGDRNM